MTDQSANIRQLKNAFDRDKAIKQLESEEGQAVADDTHARNG